MNNMTTAIKKEALNDALMKISEEKGINIFKMPRRDSTSPIVYGINWSAKGTVSYKETIRFARDLETCANIAEHATLLQLDAYHVLDNPRDDYTVEEFYATVDKIKYMLENDLDISLREYMTEQEDI